MSVGCAYKGGLPGISTRLNQMLGMPLPAENERVEYTEKELSQADSFLQELKCALKKEDSDATYTCLKKLSDETTAKIVTSSVDRYPPDLITLISGYLSPDLDAMCVSWCLRIIAASTSADSINIPKDEFGMLIKKLKGLISANFAISDGILFRIIGNLYSDANEYISSMSLISFPPSFICKFSEFILTLPQNEIISVLKRYSNCLYSIASGHPTVSEGNRIIECFTPLLDIMQSVSCLIAIVSWSIVKLIYARAFDFETFLRNGWTNYYLTLLYSDNPQIQSSAIHLVTELNLANFTKIDVILDFLIHTGVESKSDDVLSVAFWGITSLLQKDANILEKLVNEGFIKKAIDNFQNYPYEAKQEITMCFIESFYDDIAYLSEMSRNEMLDCILWRLQGDEDGNLVITVKFLMEYFMLQEKQSKTDEILQFFIHNSVIETVSALQSSTVDEISEVSAKFISCISDSHQMPVGE